MVPHTECSLEPYCVMRKVCRQVPVCVPVCPPPCPPCPPDCGPVSKRMTNSEWFARVHDRALHGDAVVPASARE